MGIEPYQLTSSIHAIVAQRLIRRTAPDGYHGRVPIAEFVTMDAPLKKAVMERADSDALTKIYRSQSTHQTLYNVGQDLVKKGITDEQELNRVSGSAK